MIDVGLRFMMECKVYGSLVYIQITLSLGCFVDGYLLRTINLKDVRGC